jgi:hypothetical protein
MKIFIDTNSYIGLSSIGNYAPLIELRKILCDKESKIELIITQQLFDEYDRNVGNITDKSRSKIETAECEVKISVSDILKPDIENKINQDKKTLAKKVDVIKIKMLKDFDRKVNKTQKLVYEIFKLGTKIDCTESILKKAQQRHIKGNPPRKNDDSYGDAINWESILSISDLDFDLAIISSDPDYAEKDKGLRKINRFLKKEWKANGGKSVVLHSYLGPFINTLKKEVVVAKEEIYQEIKSSDSLHNDQIFKTGINLPNFDSLTTLDMSPYYKISDSLSSLKLNNDISNTLGRINDFQDKFIKLDIGKKISSFQDETFALAMSNLSKINNTINLGNINESIMQTEAKMFVIKDHFDNLYKLDNLGINNINQPPFNSLGEIKQDKPKNRF